MKMIIINGMRTCSPAVGTADLDRLVDQLGPGTLHLTVPLVDDAVQVGIGGDFATTILVVAVTASTVWVRRLDGGPLQVHLVEGWRSASAPGVVTPIFDAPVEAAMFERCGTHWISRPRLSARAAELDRFVGTLVRFALAKHGRATGQALGAA